MTHRTTVLSLAPFLALGLAGLIGCAGVPPTEAGRLVTTRIDEASKPGMVFMSIEEAAIAAVARARANATPVEREALLIGSIIRVEGGYSWLQPQHSGSYFRATRRPRARLAPSQDHVATYLVHPRTGEPRLDRINERFSQSERDIVDRADPFHRPIFLLTPSGRILAYGHEEPAVQIADLRRRRMPTPSATEIRRAAKGSDEEVIVMVREGVR